MKIQNPIADLELIQKRMRELDLTSRGLARATGLSENFVQSFVTGRKRMPTRCDTLERIADALGFEAESFQSYRQQVGNLSPEVLLVRKQMRLRGMTAEELHAAMAATVQLPYLKSILAGSFAIPMKSPIRERLEIVLGIDLSSGRITQPEQEPTNPTFSKSELPHLASLIDAVTRTGAIEPSPVSGLVPEVYAALANRLRRLPDSLLAAILRLRLRVDDLAKLAGTEPDEIVEWLLGDSDPAEHPIGKRLLDRLRFSVDREMR